MYRTTVTALALLLAPAAAKTCINQTIPVTISARQPTFNLDLPTTNLEATDFLLNNTQQGRNFSDVVLDGYHTTTGTYMISTQFCKPSDDSHMDPTVQILTHGIGFDKTYWDLSFNGFNYSYVDYVTKMGYCTLSFDRLGVGNSSHGEPLNEIQAGIEVAATVELTRMLRNGTFPQVNHTFTKTVHVGHSFGSSQTYTLANMYPELTDAIVLTGFSMNASFVPLFATGNNFQQAFLNQPLRFGNLTGEMVNMFINTYASNIANFLPPVDLTTLPMPLGYPPGYLVNSNIEANKYLFFHPKAYDPEILQLAERTKQPVTPGEVLTLAPAAMMNNYCGPVMVIAGSADLPYCGSDCTNTGGVAPSLQAMLSKNFPNVDPSNFTSYVQPNTGHGINLHYNSTGAYGVIQEFIGSKGLMST